MAILISIMINLFSREFTSIILGNNEQDTKIIINLIDNNLYAIAKMISREANKTNIVSTVMNPEDTKYYIADYLEDMNIGDYSGAIHLLAFNLELIKETEKIPNIQYDNWVKEEKISIDLLNNSGLIGISTPVRYNGFTEGYLIFTLEFNQIFFNSINQLDLLKNHSFYQFKAYLDNKVISETGIKSDNNLTYLESLKTLPEITVEILTPKTVIDNSIKRLTRNFALIAIMFSIVTVSLITFLTSRSIAKPLIKLKNDIDNASNSHGEIVTLKNRTANEIIIVGKAFNKIHRRLIRRTEELERRNKELESTQKQLIQNEKMASIGQLAAGVAHEINNPTGFVKTNLETMNEYCKVIKQLLKIISPIINNKDFENIKIIEEIKKLHKQEDINFIMNDMDPILEESLDGTKRIQKIVQGLRNFARQDNEVFSNGNVNRAIENAIILTQNEIKYKCKIHKSLMDLPEIVCNLDQLTQVFVNLLINGSHAIKDHGDIYIISKYKNEKIIIKIADNGSGIEKENISKLFEPFFSTKDIGKGTGLGLAISLGIIETHNGNINVISKVGLGTCFTIEIPVTT